MKVTFMQKADELGTEYMASKEVIKQTQENLSNISAAVIALASKKGTRRGKQMLVDGDVFSVGYTLRAARGEFDLAKLKKLVDKKTFMSITSRVIDSRKLQDSVAEGVIKRSVLAKCYVEGPPSKVVAVKVKGADDEGPQEV